MNVNDAWNNPAVSDDECLQVLRFKKAEIEHAQASGNHRLGTDKALEAINDMIFSLEKLIDLSGGNDE